MFLNLNFKFIQNFVHIEIHESKLTRKPESLINLKTRLGNLIGYKKEVLNRTINVFYGAPYAQPPVGKLRFKKTKLIKEFPENPYRALEFKPHCAHKRPFYHHKDDVFSEDCLFMNIYTPNLENLKVNGKCEKRYSVMIYIMGGELFFQ